MHKLPPGRPPNWNRALQGISRKPTGTPGGRHALIEPQKWPKPIKKIPVAQPELHGIGKHQLPDRVRPAPAFRTGGWEQEFKPRNRHLKKPLKRPTTRK